MRMYLFILWVLSAFVTVYMQLRYARANYPSMLWRKLILFLSAFITGAVGMSVFLYQEATWRDFLLFTVFIGLFSGLGFTFLFPSNIQRIIPKRKEPSDDPLK